MCTLFVARSVHPHYPLIVASNRDEAHERPTASAAFWDDAPRVLAGRDLRAGGAWHGITTEGRWAIVTNIRAPQWMRSDFPRSRGALVADYLRSDEAPADFAARAAAERDEYGGFNLLLGSPEALWFVSSTEPPRALGPGFYGLSNGTLGEPWPKVARGGQAFQRWVEAGAAGEEALFEIMRNPATAPDGQLPSTGVGLDLERTLSALFIEGPAYGTRTTTLLTVRDDDAVRFAERSFGPNGAATGAVEHDFQID
ncbi:MAG: NRDE family protein [Bacteroidota bacterium]